MARRVGKQDRDAIVAGAVRRSRLPAAGESAAGAAERFAERAGDDVDLAHDAAIFMRAAPGLAEKTGRVRVVDHRRARRISRRDRQIACQIGDGAVHREAAVGGDQSEARVPRFAQLRFEIGHVVVLVTKTLRFAEPDAVDDRGVIQFIGDDGVLVAEQRLEQAAVGIESRRDKESCLRSREIW